MPFPMTGKDDWLCQIPHRVVAENRVPKENAWLGGARMGLAKANFFAHGHWIFPSYVSWVKVKRQFAEPPLIFQLFPDTKVSLTVVTKIEPTDGSLGSLKMPLPWHEPPRVTKMKAMANRTVAIIKVILNYSSALSSDNYLSKNLQCGQCRFEKMLKGLK